ncbi:hypothetical protein H5410_059873 [Solanum commersonii]|uniref:Uncharacterized protein n=1 Tax=Solanum commersonii TaxID=4109 RepID=A0A9J5W3J5_SOLCO|nr:hypothetical protein H5410_059873 [Solanum commersonii]
MASMKSQFNVLLSLYPCRVCSFISTGMMPEQKIILGSFLAVDTLRQQKKQLDILLNCTLKL